MDQLPSTSSDQDFVEVQLPDFSITSPEPEESLQECRESAEDNESSKKEYEDVVIISEIGEFVNEEEVVEAVKSDGAENGAEEKKNEDAEAATVVEGVTGDDASLMPPLKIKIEDPVTRRRRRRQQKALTLVDEISLFNPSNLKETRTKVRDTLPDNETIQREQQISKVIEEKDWHTFLNMVESLGFGDDPTLVRHRKTTIFMPYRSPSPEKEEALFPTQSMLDRRRTQNIAFMRGFSGAYGNPFGR